MDNYFDELKSLYQIYYPLVKPLLHHIAQTLLTLSKSEQARSLNAHSIDIMSWLERESSRPSLDVMLDTDISMPLIAAIQLLNVWIVCRNLDVEPGFLHKVIKGKKNIKKRVFDF